MKLIRYINLLTYLIENIMKIQSHYFPLKLTIQRVSLG